MKLHRLPDWRIRNGILHHYQGARQEALGYFADSLTEDRTAMPVAIQAIEKWGWEEAFEFSHVMTGLTQSEGTLLWLVSEMAKAGRPESAAQSNHCMHLSRMISGADAGLLAKHKAGIMALEGLHPKERARIEDRVGLLGRDATSCWEALERLCEEGKKKDYVNEVNMDHAYELVEAISREGEAFTNRVLDLLSELNPTLFTRHAREGLPLLSPYGPFASSRDSDVCTCDYVPAPARAWIVGTCPGSSLYLRKGRFRSLKALGLAAIAGRRWSKRPVFVLTGPAASLVTGFRQVRLPGHEGPASRAPGQVPDRAGWPEKWRHSQSAGARPTAAVCRHFPGCCFVRTPRRRSAPGQPVQTPTC